jgi:hypothetical protein
VLEGLALLLNTDQTMVYLAFLQPFRRLVAVAVVVGQVTEELAVVAAAQRTLLKTVSAMGVLAWLVKVILAAQLQTAAVLVLVVVAEQTALQRIELLVLAFLGVAELRILLVHLLLVVVVVVPT